MRLTITDEAQAKLNSLGIDENQTLLLWYERKGLGCTVNGLPTIRFTKSMEPLYKKVDNLTYPTYVDGDYEEYFDEDLTLHFTNGMFRLQSPGGILNAFISPSSLIKEE